ncbi:MAG: MATE family efflux transporter [Ruminococcaceae bacterium]|nr:MATE family efflux transporter [Oscillospiraceae bacterium]
MEKVHRENKMGTMPVEKLLISVAVPMIFSMFVQALYNIVDSIFVARLSQDAFTALSLAFSLQNIMISVGVGTGVGVNAFLSKSLGEKDFKTANKIANNSIFLAVCTYIVFLVLGLTITDVFLKSQTKDPAIIQYGTEYLRIVLCCSFGIFMQNAMERLLTSTGRTVYSMATQVTGAVINIILDPIMIFGYLGCPAMGVKGAAIATVIGQVSAAIIGLIFNLVKNKDIKLSIRLMKPEIRIIKKIYSVAIPSIAMGSIGSIMVFSLNKILMGFTKTAVAVLGAYFTLQSFVFMPVFGLNSGMVPIIAYNYGAKNRERIIETIKFALKIAFGIMCIGLLSFEVFPHVLLSLFKSNDPLDDAAMIKIGVPALRTMAINFPIAGISIMLGSTFQALGKANYSLVVALMRQLVVLLPVAYLLSLTGVLNYVWIAFPLAGAIALFTSGLFFRRVLKLIDFK